MSSFRHHKGLYGVDPCTFVVDGSSQTSTAPDMRHFPLPLLSLTPLALFFFHVFQ